MKSKRFISLSILAGLSIGLFAGAVVTKKAAEGVYTPTFATYTNGDGATYYSTIDTTKSGNALLVDLRTLNLAKRKSTVGYSSMGTTPSGQFKYTDYDPDYVQYDSNGQPYGTRISSFYTYTSATSWNREHVWPNSHGGGSGGDAGSPYPDADIHMPRPTISSENSSRGNSFFVEGMNNSSSGWDPYTAGYSADSRGEAARITFYCMLVNSKLNLAPTNTAQSGTDPITGTSYGGGHTMGNLETLLKWNINYPVTQRERNRNEGAEYLQGNRNAFVDHPEFACKIWGSVNSTTQSLCQNAHWDIGHSVSISASTASVVVDNTASLYASASDGSNITWSTSDANTVALSTTTATSGTPITITGIAPGTATVTATATIDGDPYTATCTVTVASSGGGGGGTPITSDASITADDLDDSSYPTTATDYTAASGVKFKAYNCANFNNLMQFKKSGGYLYTTQSINLGSITLNSYSGSLTVYGGTSQNPNSNEITGLNGTYDLTGYTYFKIINNSSGVARCESIDITLAESGGGEDPTLDSIEISTPPTKTDYTVGEYFNPEGLIIRRNYSDDNDDTYSYAGHESEFSFSPSLDTALTKGDMFVTITYEGLTCQEAITVTDPEVPAVLESITLSGQRLNFTVGDTFTFGGTVTAHYSNGEYENVTWATTFSGYNMNVASTQEVTATYTEDGITVTATYNITVEAYVPPVVNVVSVSLNTEYEELHIGDTFQLEATINPSNATNKSVTWSFTNYAGYDSVITLSDDGLVTAVAAGVCTVTVTTVDGNKTAECMIEVVADPVPPTPKPNADIFGCGGSVVATSVILSTLALTGLSVILVRKNKEK